MTMRKKMRIIWEENENKWEENENKWDENENERI